MLESVAGTLRENYHNGTVFHSFVPTALQSLDVELGPKQLVWLERAEQRWLYAGSRLPLAKQAPGRHGMECCRAGAAVRSRLSRAVAQMASDIDCLVQASQFAQEHLERLPLSGRWLQDVHAVALAASHNAKSTPGWFRLSPVWIGASDATLQSAAYVPPVGRDMQQAIFDLEQFIHGESQLHPLVRAALVHYQFETIHPFLDGNGRLGWLLTQMFMWQQGATASPFIPIVQAMRRNVPAYFQAISSVQVSGAYDMWITYFLKLIANM